MMRPLARRSCSNPRDFVRDLFTKYVHRRNPPLPNSSINPRSVDSRERLVEAAKRAGADAADAVAVRGVSQGVEVRDGRVEESERSEGDDVGLRVLVGRRQATVSTNDVGGDNVAKLAERAVAMARVAPDDQYVGLADPSLLARNFPDLDLLDPGDAVDG